MALLDAWKENWIIRLVVCVVLMVLALAITFLWNPMQGLGGMAGMAQWATVIGAGVAVLSLFVTPFLDEVY